MNLFFFAAHLKTLTALPYHHSIQKSPYGTIKGRKIIGQSLWKIIVEKIVFNNIVLIACLLTLIEHDCTILKTNTKGIALLFNSNMFMNISYIQKIILLYVC